VLLQQAGYAASPPIEVRDVYRAIAGALFGPKATLMEGQTHALRVLATTFSQ